MIVSYPLWGLVSDRWGRKKSTLLASLWISTWSLLCCVAPSVTWLIAFRLFYSLAGGAVNLLMPYSYEVLSTKHQWLGFTVIYNVSSAIGNATPIIAALVFLTGETSSYSWKLYFLSMTVPVLIFMLIALLFLHESPRFLISKGKTEASAKVLRKIAGTKNNRLPESFTLVPEIEMASRKDQDNGLTLMQKYKLVFRNRQILLSLICIVAMGIAARFIFYGMNFVKTELVFMQGQSGSNYCASSLKNTYNLEIENYLQLLYYQIVSDAVGIVGSIFVLKLNFSLKKVTMTCFTFCIILTAVLYFCPPSWMALGIFSLIQILGISINIKMWLSLSGLLPTNIRSSLFGLCSFLMCLPLPIGPYFIQVLSKVSQHLVTSVCMAFMACGFMGSVLVPKKIYAN
ncbi:synaptic vesicle 2-related protein-like [Symsagittifera roscoffensis]|uniref:synaptic vesicle 2-related protein-like n=1 Tax=Symsagittifera roscoffensis TaxID=84072 RepID=UPI00307B77A7